MSRVHRRGMQEDVKRTKRRAKRPCYSAPAAPTNVTLDFGRREVKEREEWRAITKWDPVTQDASGRSINVAAYAVQWRATDASGNPVELDGGQSAVWRQRLEGDDETRAVLAPIARPRTWYYQTRARAARRVAGRLCWGPWSAWTTPVQPATGAVPGPPAPTGQTLTFTRDTSRRGSPWIAVQTWNEVPQWTPTDGDPVEGAARYAVRLQVRRVSDGVVVSTRRAVIEAKDADSDTTAQKVWGNISRKFEYRSDVRPIDLYGRRGAWAGWTAWSRPPALTAPVTNLVWKHPKPRLYVARWDPPTDDDGVIGYRVRVYRDGTPASGTLVETADVGLAQRYEYHVPTEDKGKQHSVRVVALYEGSVEEGTTTDSGTISEAEQWDAPDLAEASVVAPTIMPGSIGSDQLAGLVQIASRLVAGDPAGARLEINETGITLYNSSGDALVSLAAGDEPSVQAHIRALSLVALGATLLQDTTVANTARLVFERKVSDPSVAPSLSVGFPASKQLQLRGDAANPSAIYDWFGLFYAANGGAGGTTPTFWTSRPAGNGYYRYVQEHAASTGAYIRGFALLASVDDAWGVVQVSVGAARYVYVLYQRWSEPAVYYLAKLDASTFAYVNQVAVTADVVAPKPGLLTDGTDLYMLTTHGTGDATHLHLVRYSADTLAKLGTIDLDNSFTIGGGSGGGTAFESGGGVIVGGKLYLALYTYEKAPIKRRGVFAFDWATKARSPSDDFLGQTGAEVDGVTHDGTSFRSVVFANPVVTHSDWTDTSAPVWMAYTWRDNTNGYESAVSPIVSTTMRRRAWLTVTWPSFPSGVDRARTYAAISSSQPSAASLKRQGTHAGSSVALGSFNAAGAAPPASNSFPGSGHGAELRTSDGAPLVRADGMSRCRVVYGTAQSIPSGTVTPVAYGSAAVQVDTDSYAQPASNRFQVPYSGQYLVQFGGRWAANATGLRRLVLQSSTDGTTWSGLDSEGARDDRLPVSGAPTQQSVAVTLQLAAGTYIRVVALQNSGGALDLVSFNFSIVFLGPA